MTLKVYENAEAALFDVSNGTSIMAGGFGLCGNPENCIRQLGALDVRDLTIISNNCGNQGRGLALLLQQPSIKQLRAKTNFRKNS